MSTSSGSRAAGVVAALVILLLGSLLYSYLGPGSEPDVPEPAIPSVTPASTAAVVTPAPVTPTPVVREAPGSRDELRELAEATGGLTDGVMELPRMGEMAADDAGYDPVIEARQIFHPFEQTLLGADPLDPESWRAAQEQHDLRNEGASRKAEFLRRSGHPDAARELMLEWSRLNGVWQARAYGRPHRPGGEPGE